MSSFKLKIIFLSSSIFFSYSCSCRKHKNLSTPPPIFCTPLGLFACNFRYIIKIAILTLFRFHKTVASKYIFLDSYILISPVCTLLRLYVISVHIFSKITLTLSLLLVTPTSRYFASQVGATSIPYFFPVCLDSHWQNVSAA